MSEPSVPFASGNDDSHACAADETRTPASFSWPARVALGAAAGLVVGGTAFAATEVAAAFNPPSPAPNVAEDEERTSSERRTTPLIGTAEPEDAEESAEADGSRGGQTDEHAADTPEQGSGGQGSADAAVPETGGGAPGTLSEGDPGWVDPRKEILEEMLNTPQDRPPMEPQITQEELDALREAAEADAQVHLPELDYSEYYE